MSKIFESRQQSIATLEANVIIVKRELTRELASQGSELCSELYAKVHKIQPQWNEWKLFRSLNIVFFFLYLALYVCLYMHVFYIFTETTHTCAGAHKGNFTHGSVSRLRKRENIRTGKQAAMWTVYLCGRFKTWENVSTRWPVNFRSCWIYIDGGPCSYDSMFLFASITHYRNVICEIFISIFE